MTKDPGRRIHARETHQDVQENLKKRVKEEHTEVIHLDVIVES